MIEINLLPEELRNRVVKAASPEAQVRGSGVLEPKHFILLAPLIFTILIIVQLIIGVFGIIKSTQLRMLGEKWRQVEPQRKALEEFDNEYMLTSGDAQAIKELEAARIIWSEKLNKLSLDLPSGVWFNELLANSKELILKGGVVSLNKEELGLIKQLIDNLKNDQQFFKDFNSLELDSAVKKTVGSYDITEFTLKGTLRVK